MHRFLDISGRLASFQFAFRGILTMMRIQRNAWIHAAATVAVCGIGAFLDLSSPEWCWLVLAMGAVWTAEALNTALEFLSDAVSPDFHPLVGKAKDVAAGGVLIAAMSAVLIGAFVVGPHFLRLMRGQ